MAGEQFVDVTYRGLEVGKSARATEFGPTTAFVEVVQPMPVGTALTVATDTGLEISASVVRVIEQIAGVENPGMRVRVGELEGDAKAWWDALVTVEDPIIPEPAAAKEELAEDPPPAEAAPEQDAGDAVAEEASAQEDSAADAASAESDVEAAPAEAEATSDAAVPEAVEDAVTEPVAKKKRRRTRKKKEPAQTTVMNVAEIQAAIAEGGDHLDDAAPTEDMGGTTMKMNTADIEAVADNAPEADATPAEDDKKKKKRRRRRSRRK